jgi:hypothetical protein
MPTRTLRRQAFSIEAAAARRALAAGDLDKAFHHLERSHVLGQPWPGAHSWAHWMMLRIGLARRDWREVRGQVIRLAAGGLLSWMGRLPNGNTGGANVPPEDPMPPPADLGHLCR